MSAPDASGFDLLSALADVRAEMDVLADTLRADPTWRDVTTEVTVRRYLSGQLCVECYVDGERSDGRAHAWTLGARWEAGAWTVEAALLENNAFGQDSLEELGPVSAATAVDLARELREIARTLVLLPAPPVSAS